MPTPRRDIAGQQFGQLTAVAPHHRTSRGWHWLVRCDCGTEKVYKLTKLTEGRIKTCGCSQKLKSKYRQKPGYSSWSGMIHRCYSPHNPGYKHYGGRGITVCKRWRESFLAFLADMGARPPGYSLDRINPDGNYEPNNCRWATFQQQTQNRRKWIIQPKKSGKNPDPRQGILIF